MANTARTTTLDQSFAKRLKRRRIPSAFRREAKGRHWRLMLALAAHRVERRIGRPMTDSELQGLDEQRGDPLMLREMWLRYGGYLEARDGRLELSKDLPKRADPVRIASGRCA